MPTVFITNNNVDSGLKNLKMKLAKDGTLSKVKDRAEGYKKPGVRSRLEKENNIRNSRKNNSRNNNTRNSYKTNSRNTAKRSNNSRSTNNY